MVLSEDDSDTTTCAADLNEHSRREFLLRVGGLAAGAALVGITGETFAGPKKGKKIRLAGPFSPKERKARRKAVYALKKRLAVEAYKAPVVPLAVNGDEAAYPNGIATFTKSLPHDDNGIADPAALQAMLNACQQGTSQAFEDVPEGGLLQFKNPMAAFAYTLEGPDSHDHYLPPPPTIASAEQASEAAEVYWQGLLRDVPFSQYASDPVVQAACDDLNRFTDFRGPRLGGLVTPQSIFRGTTVGELEGPYLSQFLLKDTTMGHTPLEQKYLCAEPGTDYVLTWQEWLSLQRGTIPDLFVPYLPDRRHLMTGRDLGHHVHKDFPYQVPITAALSMTEMHVPVNSTNPYRAMPRQCAFGTLGQPDALSAVAQVSNLAIKAAWRHKWMLHRRTRPEEFGARVHRRLTVGFDFPANPEFLSSKALEETFSRSGTYLLSQAFPEGCPAHPSYASGHSTFMGACVTVLKAFYDEAHLIPNPVVPSDDGQSLVPYNGPPLTVGSELNKLASNSAFGRNFAGLHWRTDATEGVRLGERVAIGLLTHLKASYREQFQFRFVSFDGAVVTI